MAVAIPSSQLRTAVNAQARAVYIRLSSIETAVLRANSQLSAIGPATRRQFALPPLFSSIGGAGVFDQVSQREFFTPDILDQISSASQTTNLRAQQLRTEIGKFFFGLNDYPTELNQLILELEGIQNTLEELLPNLNNLTTYSTTLRGELLSWGTETARTDIGTLAGQNLNTPPAARPTEAEKPPAPKWGVKFSIPLSVQPSDPLLRADELASSRDFYLSLLPAMGSVLNMQGSRDVPNSMPGLQFRVIPNVGKQRVPGFQSVYQHLGMDSVQVTMVGCFLGNDGEALNNINPEDYWDNSPLPTIGPNQTQLNTAIKQLDSYRAFQEFYKFAVLSGRELEVEINTAKNTGALAELNETQLKSLLRTATGNPKFKCVVRNMEVFYAKADRTWYTIQMEVTDLGLASKTPINLTNKISEGIEKAQEDRLIAEQRSEEQEIVELANALRSEYQHDKYVTTDGCTIYEFKGGTLDGKAIKQCLINNVPQFEYLDSAREIEAERAKRTGEISVGDGISALGSAFFCVAGVITAKSGVGLAAAALSCPSAVANFQEFVQGRGGSGDTFLRAGAELAIGPALGGLGRLLGPFIGPKLAAVVSPVAQAGGRLISPVTSRIPGLQSAGQWLQSALGGSTPRSLVDRVIPANANSPAAGPALLRGAGDVINRLRNARPTTSTTPAPGIPSRPTPPPPPNPLGPNPWLTPNPGTSVPVTDSRGSIRLINPPPEPDGLLGPGPSTNFPALPPARSPILETPSPVIANPTVSSPSGNVFNRRTGALSESLAPPEIPVRVNPSPYSIYNSNGELLHTVPEGQLEFIFRNPPATELRPLINLPRGQIQVPGSGQLELPLSAPDPRQLSLPIRVQEQLRLDLGSPVLNSPFVPITRTPAVNSNVRPAP